MAEAARSNGRFGHAVEETVAFFAAAPLRKRIVDEALFNAREVRIPEGPERLALFVSGHLYPSLERYLGEHLAKAVLQELDPLLARANAEEESGVRISRSVAPDPESSVVLVDTTRDRPEAHAAGRARAGGLPTTGAPTAAPICVFVASTDAGAVKALATCFGGHATISATPDVFTLMETLETRRVLMDDAVVLIVDGKNPSIRPETLITLGADLPSDMRIVAWGSRDGLRDEIETITPGTEGSVATWRFCDGDTSPDRLASLIDDWLGRRPG